MERAKKSPSEQLLNVTPESSSRPVTRKRKVTPRKRAAATASAAAEEVSVENQDEEIPAIQPVFRRSSGRTRKPPKPDDKTTPLLTTPLEDVVVSEHTDPNAPTNVKGYANKATFGQSEAQLNKSDNIELTEIVEQMGCDIDSDEIQSGQSEARVSVSCYEVKADMAPTLKLIFSKFGDLAKDCIYPSSTSRARHLETVCTIYRRLEALSLKDIKLQEVYTMLEDVKDLEISNVNVVWLRERLVDIYRAREAVEKKQRNVLATHSRTKALEKYKKEFEGHEKALEAHKKELECCKEKLKAVEEKIVEEERALAVEEAEGKKISEMFSEVSALKALCQISSLTHDLLESI